MKYTLIFLQEALRRSIFNQNLQHIEKHNAEAEQGLHSYTLGINQFADMTHEEFLSSRPTKPLKLERQDLDSQPDWPKHQLPPSVDWRQKVKFKVHPIV